LRGALMSTKVNSAVRACGAVSWRRSCIASYRSAVPSLGYEQSLTRLTGLMWSLNVRFEQG
jgi:hypothetical protein